ncbi:MAG: hypothetical protein GY781_11590 [Gammaproteobacteria bacterium]|nr:hypothetical protein [Gammaproteobacteria bacterium]
MNKRIILNVMIVALLTFYMIFNIVYKRLIDRHEPPSEKQLDVADIWQSPYLVPQIWQLTRLETPSVTLQMDKQGKWITGKPGQPSQADSEMSISGTKVSDIASSWQNLKAEGVSDYQQLPLQGSIILAFVAEDSQPLVYRVIEETEQIIFYRMIDQKKFSFSLSLKTQLIPE